MLFKSNSAFCSLVMIGFAILTSGNILYGQGKVIAIGDEWPMSDAAFQEISTDVEIFVGTNNGVKQITVSGTELAN